MMRATCLSAVLAALLLPGTASAQTLSAPTPLLDGVDVRIINGRDQAGPRAVDDSTLRYHASRGDMAAVNAEIERLRRDYPGWQPPADLYATGPAVDVQPVWELYKKADYAGVRRELARLQAANPEWRPPALLLELTEANEVRATLQARETAQDWPGLIAAANANPRQLSCEHVDNMWRLADAHTKLKQPEAAMAVYGQIVSGCENAQQRIATLQKAQAGLGAAQARELFALEATRPKSPAETDSVARLQQQVTAAAAPRSTAPSQPKELTALYARSADAASARAAEQTALARKDAAAARKIGWLYYDAKDHASAAKWFALSYGWKPEEETARGLALSRAELGDVKGIEPLATAWPTAIAPILATARSGTVAKAFEQRDHQSVLESTRETELPELILMRSWTFMRLERPTEASTTFERALRLGATSDSQREEALYGLARANIAIGSIEDAARIGSGYELTPAHRQEVRGELLLRQADQASNAGNYYQTLALLQERRALVPPDRAVLAQEAWANYHVGKLRSAEKIFADLNRVIATDETEEGLRVVRQRLNGYD